YTGRIHFQRNEIAGTACYLAGCIAATYHATCIVQRYAAHTLSQQYQAHYHCNEQRHLYQEYQQAAAATNVFGSKLLHQRLGQAGEYTHHDEQGDTVTNTAVG